MVCVRAACVCACVRACVLCACVCLSFCVCAWLRAQAHLLHLRVRACERARPRSRMRLCLVGFLLLISDMDVPDVGELMLASFSTDIKLIDTIATDAWCVLFFFADKCNIFQAFFFVTAGCVFLNRLQVTVF